MTTMTRRKACVALLGLPALRVAAQNRPDSFRIYTDSPRLFLRPARLKLLRRERQRQSLRWEQFDALWTGNAPFPETGWAAALRYQIAEDEDAGKRAVAWAAGQGNDVRQIALVADWCAPLLTGADHARVLGKLQRALGGGAPQTIGQARDQVLAAIALNDAQPGLAEKTLHDVFEDFWLARFVASLRDARSRVTNADACALMEILHAVRDNINFDLRDTFPRWFKDYPLLHVMAHYPPPWPASENEFRIPAEREFGKTART